MLYYAFWFKRPNTIQKFIEKRDSVEMVKVQSSTPRVMTHDKEEEAKRQEDIAAEEAALAAEQGDAYTPMGPFDKRNPAALYNVIVFAVEDVVYRIIWAFVYLIPSVTSFAMTVLFVMYPWFVNMLFFFFWPPIFANGIYLIFCKNLFWDYDYAYGNENFLFIDNPYLTYNDEYDKEYSGVDPVFVG